MNASPVSSSFISASHLFINAHKAVAVTYPWQSPLSCLSDETGWQSSQSFLMEEWMLLGQGVACTSHYTTYTDTQTCARAGMYIQPQETTINYYTVSHQEIFFFFFASLCCIIQVITGKSWEIKRLCSLF